jgi:hypothetical protein
VLSCTRRFLFILSLLLLILHGTAADTGEPKPTPKQIAQWVEELGDNDFKVRENASKNLWQAGAAAEPALEKAAKSSDREVVRRARELLDQFHWGIYPDTPADIAALIRAYQSSGGNSRWEVFQQLLDSGEAGLQAVLKIALAEKDENQRKALGELFANKLPAAYFLAVTEGKYERFERLLELGHEAKFVGHNLYAAYWLLRGKLAERIAHFRARLSQHPEDKWFTQTLVYLHRANGDLGEARKLVERADCPDLLEAILLELGEWKTLAAKETLHIGGATEIAEKWAYRAAFARLAGAHKEFEDAVRQLRKFAEEKQKDDLLTFVAAKGLLLNDQAAHGIELLRTLPYRRADLFDILCARLDFAAALKLAEEKVPANNNKELPSLDFRRARLLCLLGEKRGEELFDRYAQRIKDEVDPYWVRSLLKEEMHAGLKDRAFAHAAKALSVVPPENYLQSKREHLYLAELFPQQATTAEVWWALLRRQFKGESPAALLKRLRERMEGKTAAKDMRAWIEQGQHWAYSWQGGNSWEQALAEAAISAGLDDLASSLLEKANNRESLVRLGDLLAAKKQWDRAAERYQQAWKKELALKARESHDPLPLYLAGDALVHGGKEQEGKKLIEQAHALPFADAEMRNNFLRALTERGHKEAARRETELLLRGSEPNTDYSGEAIRRLAVAALARKDYLQAAEGFEKSMLRCLRPDMTFVSKGNYSFEPAKIHQLRASVLLAAGKLDEALKHIELALIDAPGYANLPIALVPQLEHRGHKKEATDLFNRCYATYEKVCRDYPRCAWAHNSAAWLSACCRLNLEAALQHAQRAVELAPTHAGYLDTLAEVHFQRGDTDKAIALQKRAIELDPKKAYFRKQLKRLEAGDAAAERPPENED